MLHSEAMLGHVLIQQDLGTSTTNPTYRTRVVLTIPSGKLALHEASHVMLM